MPCAQARVAEQLAHPAHPYRPSNRCCQGAAKAPMTEMAPLSSWMRAALVISRSLAHQSVSPDVLHMDH